MLRRDISKALFATAAASAVVVQRAEAQSCTAPCYPQTAAEIAAINPSTGEPGIVPVNYSYPPGNVYRYGTNTSPGTTDMTYALQASLNVMGISGGRVIWPGDVYLTSAPLLAENLRGLTIQADGGQFGFVGTRITAKHSGKAILSLVGSLFCTIGPVVLEGSATTTPKTGLLLGRSSASSAGNHNFHGTNVEGNYSVAAVYNIASEDNNWFGVTIEPNAAPLAALYMSGSDTQGIGGLTGSSMEANSFFGGQIGSSDTGASSTAVYLDTSAATGHIHFYGTYLVKQNGNSFVTIRLGAVDGASVLFPIGFHDCFGETGGATGPLYGVYIVNALGSQLYMCGLTLRNVRFQGATSYHLFCTGGGGVNGVYLIGPEISTPYCPTALPGSSFGRIDGGRLSLLAENSVTIATLNGSFLTGNLSSITITSSSGNVTTNVSVA